MNGFASEPCRVVALISGNGSNLQALIDAQQQKQLPIVIVAVISNKANAYGLQRANQAGIPAITIEHKLFHDREDFDQVLMQEIDQNRPDLVVLAGFMRILTAVFVRYYEGRLLNIHPSLLPKYQGLHTHQKVLAAGDKQHGATVHFVTEKLDGGPVVVQAVVPITPNDTEQSLAKKVQTQEHRIYPMAVQWFASKRLSLATDQVFLDGELLPETGHRV